MGNKKLSIEEKIALLSDTEKAYVMGYIDKALLAKKGKKKTAKEVDEEEALYEHEEGRYDGEV